MPHPALIMTIITVTIKSKELLLIFDSCLAKASISFDYDAKKGT